MIGVTITPSQIDYSKIITPETVEKMIVGECVILTGFAKELVPVDKGELKNSLMWTTNDNEGGFNDGSGATPAPPDAKIDRPNDDITGYCGSGSDHAGPVEFGRKDMPSYPRQPYLRPAVDYSKKQRETRRQGIIKTAIKQAYKPGTNNG